MGTNEVILLIALSAALAVWGLVQWLFNRLDGDRARLQNRLVSEWRNHVSELTGRSVLQAETRSMPALLARSPFFRKINRQLIQAYPEAKLSKFLAIDAAIAGMLFFIVSLAMDSLIAGVVAAAAGAYAPMLVINGKRSRRQAALADQLPEALDFLSRILRAGHSLSTGFSMMGDELPKPIGAEFRRCHDEHSLGQPLEEAMRDMAARIDNADFAFFVTAVLIQRQTGGDLGEVLGNIAGMVRSRIRLQQHVKAITAEGRLTGYILVGFPAVLFIVSYVMNPDYAGILLRTEVGKILLGSAVGLQMLGLLAIRKIVAVKV